MVIYMTAHESNSGLKKSVQFIADVGWMLCYQPQSRNNPEMLCRDTRKKHVGGSSIGACYLECMSWVDMDVNTVFLSIPIEWSTVYCFDVCCGWLSHVAFWALSRSSCLCVIYRGVWSWRCHVHEFPTKPCLVLQHPYGWSSCLQSVVRFAVDWGWLEQGPEGLRVVVQIEGDSTPSLHAEHVTMPVII